MSLPSSGQLKMSNLRSIIGPGGSGSISMSQYKQNATTYYCKGIAGVGDTNLSMSQFYGKSRASRNGVIFRVYTQGYFADDTNWFNSQTEVYSGIVTDMTNTYTATGGIVSVNGLNAFSIEWFGYFNPPTTGTYTFYTTSDDSSYLWIGSTALTGYTTGNCLLFNSWSYGERTATIYLTGGTLYPFRIQYGDGGGPDFFGLAFAGPNIGRTSNFSNYLFTSYGTSSIMPSENARMIKLAGLTTSGNYYVNVNGTSTLSYCLLNNVTYNTTGWGSLSNTFIYGAVAFNWTAPYDCRIQNIQFYIGQGNNGANTNIWTNTGISFLSGFWPWQSYSLMTVTPSGITYGGNSWGSSVFSTALDTKITAGTIVTVYISSLQNYNYLYYGKDNSTGGMGFSVTYGPP